MRSRPGEYGKRNGSLYSHLPALTLNIRTGDSLIAVPGELTEWTEALSQGADLANTARDSGLAEVERNRAVEQLQTLIQEVNQHINPRLTGFFASDESLGAVISSIKKRAAQGKELVSIRFWLMADQSIENGENWLNKNLPDWTMTELERVKSALMVLTMAVSEVIIKRPFNWTVEFPQIFDPRLPKVEQGFSVILGNPPYFNVDATFGRNAPELTWLKYTYGDIYTDKTDILFYFFRRGYDLLKTGGYLSFIVSRAFIQGDKSAKLRQFLSQNTRITGIIDFLGHRVFNAGIATCIIQWKKSEPSPDDHFDALYVIDLNQFKQLVKTQISLKNSGVNITVSQNNLSQERWQISPYDL
ncbi:MAG: Eco57I restriction-modification methylase domain-containing protein, partial [Microcystaceae cyanobacterium]